MNSRDNEAYRNELRKQVEENYSPMRHIILNSIVALMPAVIFGFMLSQVTAISLLSLFAIPFGLLLGNFIEYTTHRYPMHRPRWSKGSRMYKRHAGQHHRAFTRDFMTIDSSHDLALIMLPAKYVLVFSAVSMLFAFLSFVLLLGTFGHILCITLSIYFFVEEMLHALFHTQWMWSKRNVLRPLAEHHRLHHETKHMRRQNFNIVFPLFDMLCGTWLKSQPTVPHVKSIDDGITQSH